MTSPRARGKESASPYATRLAMVRALAHRDPRIEVLDPTRVARAWAAGGAEDGASRPARCGGAAGRRWLRSCPR